jgi:hypothetical protein
LTRSSIVIGPCELVVLSAFSATKFARQGKSLRGDLVRGTAQTNPPVEQDAPTSLAPYARRVLMNRECAGTSLFRNGPVGSWEYGSRANHELQALFVP